MQNAPPPYRFGRFRLDPVRRALLVDGEPARLGARAIDVLIALVQRRDRVVSKNEIFDLVWPGLVVEENNLQVHVSALRKLLGARTIATIPGRGYQFVAHLDDDAVAPVVVRDASHAQPVQTNLPASLPPLLGRADEVATVVELLSRHAVVTVAGAAGIGKTALALAVAQQALANSTPDSTPDPTPDSPPDPTPGAAPGSRHRAFAHGVWLMEFAALADPAQVAPLVARTLAIGGGQEPTPQTIAAALRRQSMLLLLDNCEHVIDGVVPLAEALLRVAPGVRLLATSQEPLKLAGEQVYRLSPLDLADAGAGIEAAARSGAVQLFVARAQAADRGFVLTADNLAAVVEICRRLDGLPLAIELAAARLPLLGVDGVLARLNERFRMLTGGARLAPRRHQTLHAAFDWSHELLSPPEQAVFRRLGVFVGGFSLALAQGVAVDERIDTWAVLDHLGVLVDKSLVIVEGRETPRYRLLETGRAFALEQLDRTGETEELLRRHARAVCDVLHDFDAAVAREADFETLLRAIAPEVDNLRAALGWACGTGGDRLLAIDLVAHSDWLCNELQLWRDGWQWSQTVLPWLDASVPRALAARFRLAAAGLGRVSMRPAHEWVGWARDAAAEFRALGDRINLYRVLCLLGGQSDALVTHEEAGAFLAEAERIEDPAWSPRLRLRRQAALEWWHDVCGRLPESREAGVRHVALAREAGGLAVIGALSNLADTEYALGNTDRAIEMCRESIAHAVERGLPSSATHAFCNIVPALLDRAGPDAAVEAIRDGRDACVRALGSAFVLLPYLPSVAMRRDDPRLAARLVGAAERAYGGSGRSLHPPERRALDKLVDQLRAALPAEEFAALSREGAGWSEDEAFERVLGR